MYYWQCENGYLYDYNKALVFTKTAKFPVSNTWDHCNTQEKLKQYNCYAIFIWMLTRCIMGNVKMVFCMTITRPLYSQKQLNSQLQIRYDSSLFNASQKISTEKLARVCSLLMHLLALSIDVIRGNGNKKHQYSVPIHVERARTLFMVVKRG